jgi:hypothetical protein
MRIQPVKVDDVTPVTSTMYSFTADSLNVSHGQKSIQQYGYTILYIHIIIVLVI